MNEKKFDVRDLVSKINAITTDPSYMSELTPPKSADAEEIFLLTRRLMFNNLHSRSNDYASETEVAERLFRLVTDYVKEYFPKTESESIAGEIMAQLPSIKSGLLSDAVAIFDGDPAARSVDEIILCYPGFLAIMAYRIAHLLYERNIPYLPRMISEYAHRMTGIDIHPGARIGKSICIDHGTGTVIGETAEIGDSVKIYQGVTIGAKSITAGGSDRSERGEKRHPTVGNGCIIYAGATILGGDTVIGDGSIIGGNVWLTHSVPPNSKIYYKEK